MGDFRITCDFVVRAKSEFGALEALVSHFESLKHGLKTSLDVSGDFDIQEMPSSQEVGEKSSSSSVFYLVRYSEPSLMVTTNTRLLKDALNMKPLEGAVIVKISEEGEKIIFKECNGCWKVER